MWRDIDRDPDTSVALLRGEGGVFSAGGDLGMIEVMARDWATRTRVWKEASDLVYNVINCTKPIVAAIEGPCVGAGLAAAMVADITVAGRKARIIDGHTRLGVAAGDHSAIVWPLLCGMAKAKYYLLLCESVNGEEAERIGLVSMVADDGKVVETALAAAEKLRDMPPAAVRWTKHALNNWLRMAGPTFDASLAMEFMGFSGPEVQEGMAALKEKRAAEVGPEGSVLSGWGARAPGLVRQSLCLLVGSACRRLVSGSPQARPYPEGDQNDQTADPGRAPHHLVGADRQTSIDFWEGVLGMALVFEQPNLDDPETNHLYFDPGDGRLITVFTRETSKPAQAQPDGHRQPASPGVHRVARDLHPGQARLQEGGFSNSGEVDRGFMYSIYFREPLGQLLELACYKFEPPAGATHADVLREAHNIRVAKGAYNIADEHLADAIELLSRKPAPAVKGAKLRESRL